MPSLASIRFLPYLLDVFKSAVLKKIGIPVEKINHLPCFAVYVLLDGFLLFQGTEVVIRKEEKKPNSRLKTRDARLRLYALELLLDELLESLDVGRIVVLESNNLTQDVDVVYLLLGCLFLQNRSPRVRERVGKPLFFRLCLEAFQSFQDIFDFRMNLDLCLLKFLQFVVQLIDSLVPNRQLAQRLFVALFQLDEFFGQRGDPFLQAFQIFQSHNHVSFWSCDRNT